MHGMKTEGWRLGEVRRNGFVRLDCILHIRRLWKSFCGAHGSPATPSS